VGLAIKTDLFLKQLCCWCWG